MGWTASASRRLPASVVRRSKTRVGRSEGGREEDAGARRLAGAARMCERGERRAWCGWGAGRVSPVKAGLSETVGVQRGAPGTLEASYVEGVAANRAARPAVLKRP